MTLKDQIAQAVENSAEKKDGLIINWENETHNLAQFRSANERLDKRIEGELVAIDNKLVALIRSTGYSEQYARQKFRNELKALSISTSDLFFETKFLFSLTNLNTNDVVTTKRFIDQLQVGERVNLDKDTDCFSVNSDVINCNGQPLRQAFNAEFIEQINRKCGSNSFPALTYTKFRLINIIPA